MPDPVVAHPDGAVVAVRVVPGASRAAVEGLHGDEVRVRVCSPPVDGRATEEVGAVLAAALGLRPREVTLLSGRTSRSKRFVVPMPVDEVVHRLGLRRGFEPPAR